MKKRINKKLGILITVLLTLAFTMVSCGQKNDASTSKSSNGEAKKKITIATGGMPKPFSYVDSSNNVAGYDIDVVKAIFEKLPQYDISFEKTEFTSIFAGLDSGRYQIGANNFAMNEQRKQKYIYSDPIFQNQYVIAVASDNKDINSFKDLLGKKTEVNTGTNYATALENYNKNHSDKPVVINYTDADILPTLQHIESGQFDFQLIDAAMLKQYIDQYGLKIKTIKLTKEDSDLIGTPYSYLLIGKGAEGEELTKDVNKALAEVVKDGKIKEISEKYFKDDFSPKSN
ncbi:transporter substrate-binding domain-containing protein [Clostridium saccharoperbutylacetonicum]|uniref:L-cystine-binding protein TcyJ n=1 Tax=Clostridium saccharoperbutylacetonicum N1-4(HMT) TaxID=931276 RepID=M1MFL3_9CLOT|nr:transporter substrate-binding domain-containing protein [Clostridium saccharoperbutylacetonicum]AGF55168.1 L-cystine-binding protein TcyJ [Clostridium saccharoperbutylacetonicum N1-4(HMT)]AQR94059.1 L-cystine-binding protein TcyJ precursor [Clostridium saccharoperbutylacetonicum]NRT64121.1 polar amino acid transport system substrate-binding protein [Clostridium saccharoperbutylacetonicum]NSB27488.1 polar amino acid transport system substrate-binding protein [Clostridium saccharoperbutylaceto